MCRPAVLVSARVCCRVLGTVFFTPLCFVNSYKPSPEALVEHYRAIGEASGGLPLFV